MVKQKCLVHIIIRDINDKIILDSRKMRMVYNIDSEPRIRMPKNSDGHDGQIFLVEKRDDHYFLEVKWEVAEAEKTTDALEELLNVPIVFGLKNQGHIPNIEQMLADGKSWLEIGEAIHWMPRTAREYYERNCHEEGTWQKDVLPILAAAVGFLQEMQPKMQVWDSNTVSEIAFHASKFLKSSPTRVNGRIPWNY